MKAMNDKKRMKKQKTDAARAAAAQAPLQAAWNQERLRIRDEVGPEDAAELQSKHTQWYKQFSTLGILKAAWSQLFSRSMSRAGMDGTIFVTMC